MGRGHIHIALAASAIITAVVSAQQSTTQEWGEYGRTAEARTKPHHDRLDVVEQRLTDLAVLDDLANPGRPTGVAMAGQSHYLRDATPSRRAEIKKLVLQRNKIYKRLARLDEQAAEGLKRGDKPLVIYARQVSAQDQLDLINLRLALLGTRFGVIVPPVPGQATANTSGPDQPSDAMTRNLEKAFARGHNRAVKMLRDDAETFMQSLDFGTFLNE